MINVASKKQVKIAGLVCDAKNCDISGNNVNLTVEIENSLTLNSGSQCYYIAGLAAYSNGGIYGGDLEEKNILTLTLNHKNSNSCLDYVSGAVAYAENVEIKGVDVVLDVDSTKITELGGLVGYASNTKILNSSVSGNWKFNPDYVNVYIGGIIGRAYRVNVENVSTFFAISNTSLKENQNLGGIIGFVDGDSDNSSSITNCLFNSNKFALNKTEYKNNNLTLGVYGKAYDGFSPINCVA